MLISIEKLEQKLMSLSTVDDIVIVNSSEQKDTPEILTPEQIKKDVSVLSRILIRGYCGWPFHSKLLKWSVLRQLYKLFESNIELPSNQVFENIGNILRAIPDNHLSIQLNRKEIKHNKRKFIDVGKNIAADQDYKIQNSGPFSIIAIPDFGVKKDFVNNPENFINESKNAIESTYSVIVDLRGNPGGNSNPGDQLAKYLYGTSTWASVSTYSRGTDEGLKLLNSFDDNNYSDKKDPWKRADNTKKTYPKFCGVKKPIYILVDSKTGSGAEMLITKMSHHPFMKLVGDNTKGCEEYGNQVRCILPNSKIIMFAGVDRRELEVGKMELRGYKPDIRVSDGTDAFDVAKADFYNKHNLLVNNNSALR